MDLLRFTTAGSVDDGKSTLIGRLLYDRKSIFQDQMEAIETASTKKGEEKVKVIAVANSKLTTEINIKTFMAKKLRPLKILNMMNFLSIYL